MPRKSDLDRICASNDRGYIRRVLARIRSNAKLEGVRAGYHEGVKTTMNYLDLIDKPADQQGTTVVANEDVLYMQNEIKRTEEWK